LLPCLQVGDDLRDSDDLPTMPPPPARRQDGLRWASHPGVRRTRAAPVLRAQARSAPLPPTSRLPQVPSSRPGPRRRLAGAFGVALAAAVAAASLVLALGPGRKHLPAHLAVPVAKLAPPLAFEQLIGSLSGADRLAARALAGACQVSAPASSARQALVTDLARAASSDRAVLSSLSASKRRLASWPASPTLWGWTATAALASLTVVGYDEAWLSDLQATGCYSDPANNLHYELAAGASAALSRAVSQLAEAWSPLARRYHLNPMKVSTIGAWPKR
jgi:hypothetical protein